MRALWFFWAIKIRVHYEYECARTLRLNKVGICSIIKLTLAITKQIKKIVLIPSLLSSILIILDIDHKADYCSYPLPYPQPLPPHNGFIIAWVHNSLWNVQSTFKQGLLVKQVCMHLDLNKHYEARIIHNIEFCAMYI